MDKEIEKNHETAPRLLIGNVVVYIADGSHHVVIDVPAEQAVNTGRILANDQGEEVIISSGSTRFEEISEVIEHWDIDRVVAALLRFWGENLSENSVRYLRTKAKEQQQELRK